MEQKVVIVGAGYAGILTAKKLHKKLKKTKHLQDVTITLIDKNPYHTMLTELHEVAAGRVHESSIRIDLERVFQGRKVEVKLDTVQTIDFQERVVRGQAQSYPYDYLVIASGSKPEFFGVEGAQANAHTLWSYEDAVNLKYHIESCFRQAARETDPRIRQALLTFYVVGAGFTGVEMAGELAEFRDVLAREHEIDPSEVRIVNVDMLARTVPTLSEKQSAKVEKRLAKMKVDVQLKTYVKEVGPDFIEFEYLEARSREETHTVIWAAGTQAADLAHEAAGQLQAPDYGRGRIQVNSSLQSPDDDRVYVVGDNIFYVPDDWDTPVLQMVENCEQSSATAAKNLAVALTGKGEMESYQPVFHGCMVSLGSRYAVAEVGGPRRKISLASFFAMFTKHFINMVYYMQVLGWNKVFSYMKHEFFTIRNQRSFVGGHFSNRTPSFLLVALRFWLGFVWLFEGIKKILEGWMTQPMLTDFFKGAQAWYASVIGGFGLTSDAVSSATTDLSSGATGEIAGQVLFNVKVLFMRFQLVSARALTDSSLNDMAFRLQVPLLESFLDKAILPNPGLQLAMQILVVVLEILVGLSLMGGLLTTVGAGTSLLLQLMFVMTTGLYLGTFWMIFAAIALLIGAGRTFGLDYYAMPLLKKRWKRIGWVRKWYLYHD
ncbi:MAG: FAD-dependent oxidoreductase [Clostridiaceae bacterium]|nr:FAD-dependent oxidoreductase [Clostridiaceae bacterium]